MTNIENPYKVNMNHHWDKGMSADLVEEVFNGTVKWICYLFAAGAVTPMRTTEFGTLNDAEQWAKDKGSEIWTYFPLGLKIKKRYVNSDGKLVTDLLPFNFETNEAIRKERELMPPENFLSRSEIDLYLNDGFTINTYQASYCKEGHDFSPIEESK